MACREPVGGGSHVDIEPVDAAGLERRRLAGDVAIAGPEGLVSVTGVSALAADTFRIGHMGDHSVEALEQMLAVLGETLAFGTAVYGTPAALVKDLMTSAQHKAIITDRRFKDIGVGLAVGEPMEGMGMGSTLSLNFGRR